MEGQTEADDRYSTHGNRPNEWFVEIEKARKQRVESGGAVEEPKRQGKTSQRPENEGKQANLVQLW